MDCSEKIGPGQKAGPILVILMWSGRTNFCSWNWSALTKTGPAWEIQIWASYMQYTIAKAKLPFLVMNTISVNLTATFYSSRCLIAEIKIEIL